MSDMNTASAYVLTVGLLTLIVLVLVLQKQRSRKTIVVWLTSALTGILLGSVGSYAAVHMGGYSLTKVPVFPESTGVNPDVDGSPDGMRGMGSGASGMGMGGGMFAGPRPKRDLATLVRKIDILTGDIALVLDSEHSASLIGVLEFLQSGPSMTDEYALAMHAEILTIFDDEQQAKLDSVRPAFRRRQGGGGFGGGGDRDPYANPFTQGANAEILDNLRRKFAGDAAQNSKPPLGD